MHEIESRTLGAQPTLVVRGKVATAEIKDFLGRAYHLVAARADECGAHFTGPPFARYRPLDAEFTEFEVEAGFPVVVQVPCRGEVEPSELPGGTAAVTLHVGPYDAMQPAYEAMIAWIEARGGVSEGPAWEVYLSDPAAEPDPAKWQTEIVQPYRIRD